MISRPLVLAAGWFTLLAGAGATASAADAYLVDASHTSVVFSVNHANMSYVYGIFREVDGSYLLDRANPANCRFRFVIQVDKIDTNHADRDTHLRSPDFFNAQQFPTITFDSTSCSAAASQDGSVMYQVTGNLTMHGVTQKVTLLLRQLGEGPGPYGKYRTGFLSQFTLNRSDFGMTNVQNLVGDKVGITVSFEGIRQEQAPGAVRVPQ